MRTGASLKRSGETNGQTMNDDSLGGLDAQKLGPSQTVGQMQAKKPTKTAAWGKYTKMITSVLKNYIYGLHKI